jgi:hypothetical protein
VRKEKKFRVRDDKEKNEVKEERRYEQGRKVRKEEIF